MATTQLTANHACIAVTIVALTKARKKITNSVAKILSTSEVSAIVATTDDVLRTIMPKRIRPIPMMIPPIDATNGISASACDPNISAIITLKKARAEIAVNANPMYLIFCTVLFLMKIF